MEQLLPVREFLIVTSVTVESSSTIEFFIIDPVISQFFPIDAFGPIMEFSIRELSCM